MIKFIGLLKRRSDLSFEEFVEYYENNHAPLATKYLPTALHYQRRYLKPNALDHQPSSADAEGMYDCLTEVWYEDRAAMDAELALLARPETVELIIEDEEKFLDRSQLRFFIIENECTSVLETSFD